MTRRQQDAANCTCEPRHPDGFGCALSLPACSGGYTSNQWSSVIHHHYGCPHWDVDDSGNGFRSFRALLGSSRTPDTQWVKTVSPYPLSFWRVAKLTPEQRIALGCVPPEPLELPRRMTARCRYCSTLFFLLWGRVTDVARRTLRQHVYDHHPHVTYPENVLEHFDVCEE